MERVEFAITVPAGESVEAAYDGLVIRTEQDGSAPSPFELFLASIGTCAGFYVAAFLRGRNLPTAGLRLRQVVERDEETGMVQRIAIDVEFPPEVPEKYRAAALRAANACAVKKHLEHPPVIEVAAR